MLINGSFISPDQKECFIPILLQNVSDSATWYLGSPILNEYYTVFDMSPEDYIQIGIADRNLQDQIGKGYFIEYEA